MLHQELLKYTDPEHRDFENVKNALKTMREVASCINEKKRQVENIKKIAEWQLAIEQWEVRVGYNSKASLLSGFRFLNTTLDLLFHLYVNEKNPPQHTQLSDSI